MSDILLEWFDKMFATNKNWDKWSDIVAAMLPDITSCEMKMVNILSMKDFEWIVFLSRFKIYVINELEIRESKKVSSWFMFIIIHNINIKVTKKKNLFLFFGYNVKDLSQVVTFRIKNIYTWMFVKTTGDNITFRASYFNNSDFNWLAL